MVTMSAVPPTTSPSPLAPPPGPVPGAQAIGVIGAGRLGTALAWCLARHGLPVVAVASRSAASARRLADGVNGCAVLTPEAVVARCDLVLLTPPDAAIAPLAQALPWRPGVAAVHCSGATELSALDSARAAGAQVGGLHPLMSAADPAAAAEQLPGCTVTIEASGPLHRTLTTLAARLGCPVNELPPGQRAAYHAAAGYASQFVHVLLREAALIWQHWGATEDQALRALLPLLRGTLASLARAGIAGGMPGPVSRGDVASVERHVQALADLGGDTLALYQALALRSVALAEERGGVTPASAAALRGLLRPPPFATAPTAADAARPNPPSP